MSLQKRIQQDMIAALKAKDAPRRGALSFVASELKRVAIDKRLEELPDPEAVSVLQKQLKLRQEAADQARAVNRADLLEANEYEIKVISEYLPKALSAEETTALAEKVIADLGAGSMKDMGKVMAECANRAPSVDKGTLSAVVKAKLGGK
jgi:uncharacterized protein YqeY